MSYFLVETELAYQNQFVDLIIEAALVKYLSEMSPDSDYTHGQDDVSSDVDWEDRTVTMSHDYGVNVVVYPFSDLGIEGL